jgi:hypothetical protein
MLEFQIEYPRHVAVLRAGVPRNPVALPSGMSGLLSRADRDRSRHLRQSSAIRTSLEKVHAFAQGLGCSSALPCAEPVLHSLDYGIELVSFRNRIRYG